MSQIEKIFSMSPEPDDARAEVITSKWARPDKVNNQGSNQARHAAPRPAAKYCHHGFVPAYCAHCKYDAPADWR